MATYSGTTTYFHNADWLGTERVRTDVNGNIYETCQGLPYGDGQECAGGEVTPMHFTGKQRDTETNLDDFPARYYSSTQGGWLSPDWDAKPVAVPYAILGNPQTLNLYSYVGGDPTNHADPDGHIYLCPNTCGATADSSSEAQNEGSGEPGNKPQTTQNLAAQVPTEAKAAIANAVNASNSPTADDKRGGFHEESVKWGKDASGNVVVSPSVPGPYAPPGTNPQTNFTPANPQTDQKLVTVDGFAHVHPEGGRDRSFVQEPSTQDKDSAKGSSAINIVVGAADHKVYFFNSSGVIGSPMKMKDFMGGQQ